ncbi:MAG: flavodoxin family protein [Proteobacteria bacterium]|nr:flavodoxin family protein [Pseudomonadota bacterium]
MSGAWLAIVWHSRTGAARQLAEAAWHGAEAAAGAPARLIAAEAADPALLAEAAGYLFVCPENLGTMSGAMKEMFDRAYYPLLGRLNGRPYAAIIAAGSDGQGARAQVERIATGWRLRRVAESLIVNTAAQAAEAILSPKLVAPEMIAVANATGSQLALGLAMGIY